MPKAVATDSLEQYKVEATQMSTHRTQARQARTNLQDGGRGSSREWGMSSTWSCGIRTRTKGNKNQREETCAACWRLSRKGTTDRRTYTDRGKQRRWVGQRRHLLLLLVDPQIHMKTPNPQGIFKVGNWGRRSVTTPMNWCHSRRRLKEFLHLFCYGVTGQPPRSSRQAPG